MAQHDMERFRLRNFMHLLLENDECVVHEQPIELIDVAEVLDGNHKAVWFRNVGPERAELVGNVMGSRRRLALALGASDAEFAATLRGRFANRLEPVEVPAAQAPVQQVVLRGDDADLSTLPVHLQHGLDGAPYISASIDFSRDPRSIIRRQPTLVKPLAGSTSTR